MSRKLDEYGLEIKDGDPPEEDKTPYETKAYAGTLFDIAQRIGPGQYVGNLAAGSLGKLRKHIEARGLNVITRRRQGEVRATLYVVSDAWLAKHSDR
jgi:hypothetical protein